MRFKCVQTGDEVAGNTQTEIAKQFPETVKVTFLANQMSVWDTKEVEIAKAKRIDLKKKTTRVATKVISNWKRI